MGSIAPTPATTFQLTAARRRLRWLSSASGPGVMFQLTAARRRLPSQKSMRHGSWMFQLTAARRRLRLNSRRVFSLLRVSTHSRSKAAANRPGNRRVYPPEFQLTAARRRLPRQLDPPPPLDGRFNSQPLEGGCARGQGRLKVRQFQLTAARRRLQWHTGNIIRSGNVSTHSRSKAAARAGRFQPDQRRVSTHSRSKAAAIGLDFAKTGSKFQLTAARRRLHLTTSAIYG